MANPGIFLKTKICEFQSFIPKVKKTPPRFRGEIPRRSMFFDGVLPYTQAEDTAEMIKSGALAFFVQFFFVEILIVQQPLGV